MLAETTGISSASKILESALATDGSKPEVITRIARTKDEADLELQEHNVSLPEENNTFLYNLFLYAYGIFGIFTVKLRTTDKVSNS